MPNLHPRSSGSAERRQQPRLELELAAEYRVLRPWVLWPPSWKRDDHRRARVRNLGPGGMLLLIEEELPASALLSLTVSLPGEEALVRSLAEVRHLRREPAGAARVYAAGVEFLSISSRDTSAIARVFLRRRLN